jgi:peptide/nickel transport system substrate-binding protein
MSVLLSRRDFLCRGALGGLAAVAPTLVGTEPGEVMPPRTIDAVARRQDSLAPFTLATNRTPSDLDPHSAYDAGSGVALQGPFEGLIRLKPGSTDEYVPLLAESWTANDDRSIWTFRLRDGVTFHDGTTLDAESARSSFERLFSLGLAPSSVLGRFIADPAQISAPDARTVVFDLGRPQPLFEAAMASAYGTAIVNVAALRQHEVDGDWGQAWAQTNSEGLGTGPYQVAAFDIESGVVLERHDDYWRNGEGAYFDRIVIRVVVEPETRRALLESGEADLATTMPLGTIRELQRHPDLVVDRRFNLA